MHIIIIIILHYFCRRTVDTIHLKNDRHPSFTQTIETQDNKDLKWCKLTIGDQVWTEMSRTEAASGSDESAGPWSGWNGDDVTSCGTPDGGTFGFSALWQRNNPLTCLHIQPPDPGGQTMAVKLCCCSLLCAQIPSFVPTIHISKQSIEVDLDVEWQRRLFFLSSSSLLLSVGVQILQVLAPAEAPFWGHRVLMRTSHRDHGDIQSIHSLCWKDLNQPISVGGTNSSLLMIRGRNYSADQSVTECRD